MSFSNDPRKRKSRKPVPTRPCHYCLNLDDAIDFKRPKSLARYITDRCKIIPRRVTGNCQFHQHRVVESIKRARHLGLLPYTIQHAIRDN